MDIISAPVLRGRLILFASDGELEIDNNMIENGIRPTAVGKKNWLFVGSEETGQRTAIIYTMTNQNDISILLPSKWLPADSSATAPMPDACPV